MFLSGGVKSFICALISVFHRTILAMGLRDISHDGCNPSLEEWVVIPLFFVLLFIFLPLWHGDIGNKMLASYSRPKGRARGIERSAKQTRTHTYTLLS